MDQSKGIALASIGIAAACLIGWKALTPFKKRIKSASQSVTSSQGCGLKVYETEKAVNEYLQFHYGDPATVMPYDIAPKVNGFMAFGAICAYLDKCRGCWVGESLWSCAGSTWIHGSLRALVRKVLTCTSELHGWRRRPHSYWYGLRSGWCSILIGEMVSCIDLTEARSCPCCMTHS